MKRKSQSKYLLLACLMVTTMLCLPGAALAEDTLRVSVLPQNGSDPDASALALYERVMALITTSAHYDGSRNAFGSELTDWDRLLVDSFGTSSQPGMDIQGGFTPISGTFTLRLGGNAFFQGAEVLNVLNGALLDPYWGSVEGLLVAGFTDGEVDLRHIELKNGLLSSQTYRNYGVLMEAELAVLKDLGYDIDLKNHYGYSLYRSGVNVTNTTGLYARNEAGDGWLVGEYNTTAGAVGLHVYGAHNRVTQAADILSAGAGSAGIRIDGFDSVGKFYGHNQVIIDDGVKVHANGEGSMGVLVAYGKNHILVNRGEIAATGEGGVAVRFDFGSNVQGNDAEYRGSWKWTDENGNNNPYLTNEGLDGALVNRFDVTGSLNGNLAAIYIAENALVEKINIMNGAEITGDIISDWDRNDSRVQLPVGAVTVPTTTLTFGYLANANGEVTTGLDTDFSLTYDGNILGRQGMSVDLAAGELTFGGIMEVISYTQGSDATLEVTAKADQAVLTADTAALEGTLVVNSPLGIFTASDLVDGDITIISTTDGISGDFSAVQSGSLPDYLTGPSSGSIINSGRDYAVKFGLSWNGGNDEGHGTFTVEDDSYFVMDLTLANETGTYLSGWDGKSLSKNGDGLLILSTVNSYTGSTEVNGGTLLLAVEDAIADSSSVTLAAGTTLEAWADQKLNELSGAGDVILVASTLTVRNDTVTELSGTINGDGALVKEGNGEWRLTGDNTYTGTTTITEGRLVADGTAALGTGDIINNARLEVIEDDSGRLNQILSGTGNFLKSGSGTLVLAGTQGAQEDVEVSAGSLILDIREGFSVGSYTGRQRTATILAETSGVEASGSFIQESGTSLQLGFTGNAYVIRAKDILLESGSEISLLSSRTLAAITGRPVFNYTAPDAGSTTLLILEASDTLINNSTVNIPTEVEFTAGVYDYTYSDYAWESSPGQQALISHLTRTYNHELGASDAVSAPARIALQNVSGLVLEERLGIQLR